MSQTTKGILIGVTIMVLGTILVEILRKAKVIDAIADKFDPDYQF